MDQVCAVSIGTSHRTELLTYSSPAPLQYFAALSYAAVPLVTAPESKSEDLLAILFTLSKVRGKFWQQLSALTDSQLTVGETRLT